ncbi:sulfur carrier protein ThiS adenylyltransferase ThiF [Clostridium sp. D2Q-11]|uniref:Sulfur carrier protein ThiS adenylyltransferase ThiF n=1 Tax=Anaeromonas frigoriresistens TaxID=2683708 RepID=A0A942UXF8_9FIRM|nr:sulfur carrier protein ThiS adenylyltransferase ThiF [Anaeromonas frigoriresistens]MBS4538594.1 sulfur carrier protein ThiS adenylyltransferase ThiF [Anaeromonas frigoriresistens]
MEVYINEKPRDIAKGTMLFDLKKQIKKDSDVIVYNGFIVKENLELKEKDRVVFIKRGEIPSEEDMEAMLVSRHTPLVHEKVKGYTVGIAGLGGLGSNVALSLARLGVGKLVLIDFDVVEPSNLNRQQYFIRHIGMNKTDALEELINECNPFVEIEKRKVFLDENNIEDVLRNVDIIVEAFDNPMSKAIITNTVLRDMKDKKIVAASGMAGHFTGNTIVSRKIRGNFYLIGDGENEARPGQGLMAPRVAIAANHQANTVLRIILGEE